MFGARVTAMAESIVVHKIAALETVQFAALHGTISSSDPQSPTARSRGGVASRYPHLDVSRNPVIALQQVEVHVPSRVRSDPSRCCRRAPAALVTCARHYTSPSARQSHVQTGANPFSAHRTEGRPSHHRDWIDLGPRTCRSSSVETRGTLLLMVDSR